MNVAVIGREERDRFMGSLNTVGSQMRCDFSDMSFGAFLRKYGHLRPGTYDILSPRYDEAPDHYFDGSESEDAPRGELPAFSLSLPQLNALERLLRAHRMEHDVLSLFNFIKGAIEGREYAKFVFTRSLSNAMSLVAEMGREVGIPKEEIAYADISVIGRLYSSSQDAAELLGASIAQGKRRHLTTRRIVLPPLICGPEDIFAFELPMNEPNFITQESVTGEVIPLEGEGGRALSGRILMIENADPGYDWIFSRGIGGFITKFGGVNSHMAIRAGELGLPAVIGAGEALYRQWAAARALTVDCANRQVHILL